MDDRIVFRADVDVPELSMRSGDNVIFDPVDRAGPTITVLRWIPTPRIGAVASLVEQGKLRCISDQGPGRLFVAVPPSTPVARRPPAKQPAHLQLVEVPQ
ncbi:MAG: hypothetical protein ACYC2K_13670 [Gemmatimonadales bacterium]